MQPRRRRAPLCLLPCYFHSLSLALAKRITNGNHMCAGCHAPAHACLWFITLYFLAQKAAQHLVVTSAPFRFEVPVLPRRLKELRTKNDTGSKPAYAALEQGLSCAIKASGEQLSAMCIYETQSVHSVTWPHTRLCPVDTQDVVCKPLRKSFLSTSPLTIWGASQSAFTACR